MSVIMESFYNMGDERHRRRLRRFIDAEDCMRKGIMDDLSLIHISEPTRPY